MNRILVTTIFIAIGLSFTRVHASGHEIGNHADYLTPEDEAAWFNNAQKTVRFCVKVASNFGFAKDELQQKVAAGFKKWMDYISARDLYYFRLPKSVEAMPGCDGSEDIRFDFGSSDGILLSNADPKAQRPVGVAVRTSFDALKSWGKGYVAIAASGSVKTEDPREFYPNWKEDQALDVLLLHELGHVFGVGHVPGTIMDEQIAYFLNRTGYLRLFNEIDFGAGLVVKNTSYAGNLGVKVVAGEKDAFGRRLWTSINREPDNFELLFGRRLSGRVKASAVTDDTGSYLTVSDDKGSERFKLEEIPGTSSSARSLAVFKTVSEVPGPGVKIVNAAEHTSGSQLFTLKTLTGKKLIVNRLLNMHTLHRGLAQHGEALLTIHAAFQLTLIKPEGAELLFSSFAENGQTVINAGASVIPK